jgi:hypothetical protein
VGGRDDSVKGGLEVAQRVYRTSKPRKEFSVRVVGEMFRLPRVIGFHLVFFHGGQRKNKNLKNRRESQNKKSQGPVGVITREPIFREKRELLSLTFQVFSTVNYMK